MTLATPAGLAPFRAAVTYDVLPQPLGDRSTLSLHVNGKPNKTLW